MVSRVVNAVKNLEQIYMLQATVPTHCKVQPATEAALNVRADLQTKRSVQSSLNLETYIDLHAALCKGTFQVQKVSVVERAMYKMNDLKQVSWSKQSPSFQTCKGSGQ